MIKNLEFYEINSNLVFSSKNKKKITFALINDMALFEELWIMETIEKIIQQENIEIVLIDCLHQVKKKLLPTENIFAKYPNIRIFYLQEENTAISDIINTFIANEKNNIIVFLSRIFDLETFLDFSSLNSSFFSFLIDNFENKNHFINVFKNHKCGKTLSNIFAKDEDNNLILLNYKNHHPTIAMHGLFFAIDREKFIATEGLKFFTNILCSITDLILRAEKKNHQTITEDKLSAELSFENDFKKNSFEECWREIIKEV